MALGVGVQGKKLYQRVSSRYNVLSFRHLLLQRVSFSHKMHRQSPNKKAVLSQGEPRDVTVNFDTYRILQRRRAVFLPQHGFLVYISDHSNAEVTHSKLIFTAGT